MSEAPADRAARIEDAARTLSDAIEPGDLPEAARPLLLLLRIALADEEEPEGGFTRGEIVRLYRESREELRQADRENTRLRLQLLDLGATPRSDPDPDRG